MTPSSPPSPPDTAAVAPPADPAAPPPAGTDPLLAFLSGKRQGERFPCHVPAVLEGRLAPVAATLLDVSQGGGLLHIDEPAFVEAEREGGTQAYLELLSVHAGGGLTLALPDGLRLGTEVVRWTAGEAGQDVSRIGVRFARTLTPDELAQVRRGVGATPAARAASAAAADGDAALPALRRLPLAPRRGALLQVLAFRALMPEAGPLVAGRALGADRDALAVRIEGERPLVEVAGLLAGHRLLVTLQERGLPLWESIADVAWIAPVEGAGSVDVGLALEQPAPRAARRRFR